MSGIVAAVLACGAGTWISAQQNPPPAQPTFRSGVELVTVDVGVVDRQGAPVPGLDPGDFVVTVDGKPRRVVTAEYIETIGARAPSQSPGEPALVSSNEGGGIGRLVVFVVDQSTLEAGDARRIGSAAARFFDGLTFADRSALMLLPVGSGVPFTWAHDRVRAALQRSTGLGSPLRNWEYGSLAEARDIANRQTFALRTVADRECRSSIFAGGAGGGGFGGAAAGGGPPAGPASPAAPGGVPGGGDAPAGGGAGGGGAGGGTGSGGGSGGGGGGGAAPRGGRGGFGGIDTCANNLQMQAESTWRMIEMTSLSSIAALRQVLNSLAQVRGDKTVILISGGWPLDMQDETSILSTVAAEAAAARATVFTMFVPGSMFAADRRAMTHTPSRDHFLQASALETLAGMTGGGTYRAEVGAEGVFDRLRRELSGYYRIGIEREPADATESGRPLKVQVTRTGVSIRAREIFDVRTYEDRDWAARLASALDSPVPASGIGLKVTSYLTANPEDSSRMKVVLTGEASRLSPGDTTFQVVVRDLEGRRLFSGEPPAAEATSDQMPFSTHLPLEPGSYIVRLAVMDSAGHVGSIDHRIDVKPVAFGEISATGPLLVRVPTASGVEPHLAMDAVLQDERLALEVSLEGAQAELSEARVAFEIARDGGGPALVQAPAAMSAGSRDGYVVAQGFADMRLLPPGMYVARAKVTSATTDIGQLERPFEVLGAARAVATTGGPAVNAARSGAATLAARAILGAVRPFAADQVLEPDPLGIFLDRIAARPDSAAPAVRDLLERAKTADLRTLDVPDPDSEPVAAAAFVRGLSLYAQKKFDPAADAFRAALRASADFYPAMVYLGACYAAGGSDRQASGAWRTALIREGDVLPLHLWLADAQLRSGAADQALQTVRSAREKWPEDLDLKRRFATASLMAGHYAEGLQAVDDLVAAKADDEPTLALALRALYDAFAAGDPVETADADRARMLRLADAYRARGGPALPLIETWVAAATGR
jgi:VWFA-related protein